MAVRRSIFTKHGNLTRIRSLSMDGAQQSVPHALAKRYSAPQSAFLPDLQDAVANGSMPSALCPRPDSSSMADLPRLQAIRYLDRVE